jgi:hypothetical protein
MTGRPSEAPVMESATMESASMASATTPVERGGHGATVLAAIGICVVVAVAFALHAFWVLPNHDNDWYLIAARRLLAGGRYGVDFMEPNPPLIILLLAPPVAVADGLGLDTYTVFSAYVCLLILLSVILARRSILWIFADHPACANLLLLGYATILSLDPGFDFGQREHLFVILFCPGLFWFAARDAGDVRPIAGTTRASILLAALGVLIKPFFMLVPLVLLGFRVYRLRSWRAVLEGPVVTFVAGAILYAAVIVWRFPEFLPEAAMQRQVYFAWNRAWLTVLGASGDAFAALCLAVVLAELVPAGDRIRTLLRYTGAAAATCMLLALLQKKGWNYHFLPTMELAEFVLAGAFAALLPRPGSQLSATAVCVAIVAQAGALSLRPFEECAFTLTRSRFLATPLVGTLARSFRGDSVLLLTGGFQLGFPSLAGVRLGSRAPSQVLLPGAVRLADGKAADKLLAATVRSRAIAVAAEDLEHYRPDVVGVDRNASKQALPENFDVLGFYLSDPRFRQAWSAYRLTTSIPGWDLYTRN